MNKSIPTPRKKGGGSTSLSGATSTNDTQTTQQLEQETRATTSSGDDGSSEWETESTLSDIGSDHDDSDENEGNIIPFTSYVFSTDDEDDDDDIEGITEDELDGIPSQYHHLFGLDNIGDTLAPHLRAVRRSTDEDVMSEFSGDEKYEPKKTYSGEDGEGDDDMMDINPQERLFSDDKNVT
ncbi:hypothetical protein BGZ65_012575, partial [Modicella reniformis]